MRRLLGGAAELVHLAAVAVLLACSATMAALRDDALVEEHAGITVNQAAQVFEHVARLLNAWGVWLGVLAFAGALLAPYLRSDRAKLLAWARTACALGTLYVAASMWPHVTVPAEVTQALASRDNELMQALAAHAEEGFSAWSTLLFLSGLNFALAAFQIGGTRIIEVPAE